ncbi:MAG: DUF3865 domain-containing protein [Pseudonocardiaceae bacterium]
MQASDSKVQAYLREFPETAACIQAVLQGEFPSGDSLVDDHLVPMIDWVFERITEEVSPQTLTAAQAELFIKELSVFARYNSQFLHRAATSVEGACFELAHEFRRNHLEEGGERGKIPAHYVLYSTALLSDLGLLVNGHVPAQETQTLLLLHDLLVTSHSPSTICGGYYATEGVAINETVLLKEITDRYGELMIGASGSALKKLDFYYSLHLDEEHEAASVDGLSVEAAHIEGIAKFIRQNRTFNLDLPQMCDGFLQIMGGMAQWWTELSLRSRRMV